MPIYTSTGDRGMTSLFGGKRVLKCEELVEVYGSIDELNSWVGYTISKIKDQKSKIFFKTIQEDLFLIGSLLAGAKVNLKPLSKRVSEMEARIDEIERQLPKINNFILPGGTTDAALAHLTRSVCRRVERQVVALSQKQKVEADVIKYFNRLSDLFFVLARFINKKSHIAEITWIGKPQQKFNKSK
ncbi:MAG: cob(I)yrinic acid a,c-diamide adenosyltransferase [Patescibacteria group bacterium]